MSFELKRVKAGREKKRCHLEGIQVGNLKPHFTKLKKVSLVVSQLKYDHMIGCLV